MTNDSYKVNHTVSTHYVIRCNVCGKYLKFRIKHDDNDMVFVTEPCRCEYEV